MMRMLSASFDKVSVRILLVALFYITLFHFVFKPEMPMSDVGLALFVGMFVYMAPMVIGTYAIFDHWAGKLSYFKSKKILLPLAYLPLIFLLAPVFVFLMFLPGYLIGALFG